MPTPTTLAEWLAHCEQLHPKDIDMGLERSLLLKQRLGIDFQVPVITVAGTNGKGSTCAMLESIGLQAGYRVGLYIKPHFVHFEERCRVNGRSVEARAGMPLTYFEFTTMAILRLLASAPLDMVILEVGLGGRLDTINAIDADCAVITSIDIDHTAYLGTDRESIGREKAGIMRAGKPVVVGDPMVPASIVAHAAEVGAELRLLGRDFNYAGDKQQWGWGGRDKRFSGLAYPALRGANQLLNASAALAAFEALRDRLPITAQAVRNGFASVELTGRFQIVPGQPTLVLDVAHNPHAVGALAENLDQMGFFPRTHVVFGAMADKDLEAILRRMAPLVDAWHFTDLPIARAAGAAELQQLHERLALKGPGPVATFRHASPDQALRAAIEAADPADRIVVFGSFFTVGGVLKDGIPRLSAKHLS
jgi:dihydrofolate synthase/folylpolyglutamate synthase